MRWRRALPWILLVAFAVGYGLVDVRNRARVDRGPKRHRSDFTVYQAAARALRDGTDPYQARNPRGYRYVYPPPLAILTMAVAGWSPPDAALLFYAISFLAIVLMIRALARLRGVGRRAALLATLVCVAFLHQAFERGLAIVILVALQGAALVLLLRRRELLAGFTLGVGGALRLSPLLPAAAAFAGMLAAGRARGRLVTRPAIRLAGGVLAGLVLGLVVLPIAVLGPRRARDVTEQWIATTRSVYAAAPGDLVDLQTEYAVNEWRFKNQAPRRVLGTWAGWITGAETTKERPALADGVARAVDLAAIAVAVAGGLLLLVLGWRRLRDPDDPRFAPAFAAAILLPIFLERYAWPNHFAAALPALALAFGPGASKTGGRAAVTVFAAGTLLLYLAHLRPFEPVGAAGPLLLATGAFLALASGRTPAGPREASASTS